MHFIKVFVRDLDGRYDRELLLNTAHIVKVEPANLPGGHAFSILTLTTGEKIEVVGTPDDLLTHGQYLFPKLPTQG
jgi:hypothetical protein